MREAWAPTMRSLCSHEPRHGTLLCQRTPGPSPWPVHHTSTAAGQMTGVPMHPGGVGEMLAVNSCTLPWLTPVNGGAWATQRRNPQNGEGGGA